MDDLQRFLAIGSVLFALGAIGFLTRRNLILIVLSAEMMLHGVSINLTAFSKYYGHYDGQAFTIFVLTIAACEAGLGLSLILTLYQQKKSLDIWKWMMLGEADFIPGDQPGADPVEAPPELPHLTPAGRIPTLSATGQPVSPEIKPVVPTKA